MFIISSLKLEALKQIAGALAAQFGSDCEVVVHDLTGKDIEHSIVHIENGHVSGRQEDGSPSQVVLDVIKHGKGLYEDKTAYLMKTDSGRILKCSTVFIKSDDGKPEYLFAINYDITNLLAMENVVKNFVSTSDEGNESKTPKKLAHDVNGLLDELIEQSVELVGVPVALMNKEDKIRAINYLNDAGAFLITKSGDKVSKYFGISKYTLYSYVDINK